MKSTYTLTLTEEQMAYIRTAVCNENMKRCIKAQACKKDGNQDGYEWQMNNRTIGHTVIDIIDAQREI